MGLDLILKAERRGEGYRREKKKKGGKKKQEGKRAEDTLGNGERDKTATFVNWDHFHLSLFLISVVLGGDHSTHVTILGL